MATRVTGNKGYMEVDSFVLHTKSWSFNHEVDDEDSTTTEDGGFENVEAVMERASGSLQAVLDMNALPTDTPPNLRAGTVITELKLHLDDPADPAKPKKFWSFKALIKNIAVESAVGALVTYNVSFKSKGAITHPV